MGSSPILLGASDARGQGRWLTPLGTNTQRRINDSFVRFSGSEELIKAGVLLALDGLHPSSKGARVKFSGKSRTVIDGPFTEAKELIAGFSILQVKSLEEAIEWVKRAPNCCAGDYEVEIRQVFEMEDFAPILSEEQIQHKVALRAKLPNQTANK
jgi:hypothetical protein